MARRWLYEEASAEYRKELDQFKHALPRGLTSEDFIPELMSSAFEPTSTRRSAAGLSPDSAAAEPSGGPRRWAGSSTDSRQVEPGDVFWALRGPHHDGGEFVAEAFERGAAGAVVAAPVDVPPDAGPIRVDDTHAALRQWAAWKRRQFTGTVIAVTGSVGKTTTRQMIHTVLQRGSRERPARATSTTTCGVPLSMAAMEPEHDYAVLELGASHPGEIAALAALCRPKVGVITQIGDAHLAGFGSRAAIAGAKAELLAALPPRRPRRAGRRPLAAQRRRRLPGGHHLDRRAAANATCGRSTSQRGRPAEFPRRCWRFRRLRHDRRAVPLLPAGLGTPPRDRRAGGRGGGPAAGLGAGRDGRGLGRVTSPCRCGAK